MFNEFEVYQMMKLRQEEIERIAQNAWKLERLQKESFFRKLAKKLKSKPKSTVVKTNCNCVCCC
ncbi:hypothetical protein COJ85_03100 [Bacillus sp. AFS076308]|uniref:hypothetical protein n=1 Tax=unclassified Bacillus (in: firmicutes) TaxID=185979 RepID=UPI000BF47452|nr:MULTISPECIES: hypothetical protein [unclassified Bacillus (in: firmicutes)]PFO08493.1 hypothetical protein COJ85_03100 [Bacillus sp. AFS076308]PGV54694.1 hypothetical protein COD92_04020 [Bacillus sp. AFS037270]